MQTLFFIYTGGGLVLALISLPLIAGKVKPNPFYGFRVPLTLENPELWYPTNKFFAKRQLIVALVEVAAAIGLYFYPNITIDGYALSVLPVFVVAFAIAFIQSWRYMKSLK
ncbi:MAG: SdpI family protein [Chloroflexi bacterium]|nr:SdpI family protein [Chloroflexota bacterium]